MLPSSVFSSLLLLAPLFPSTTFGYRGSLSKVQVGDDYLPALARRLARLGRFAPRDGATGESTIGNVGNTQYVSNITVGGTNFVVILDTGSSDLWVSGKPASSQDLGVQASIQYAIGNAAGNVHTANVTFSDFTVPAQAFIQVDDTSSFGSLAAVGIQGLAGLGPGFASIIFNKVGASKGETLLDSIFQQNKTTNNFITFLLSRNGDQGQQVKQGEFTISEIITDTASVSNISNLNLGDITNQPKLPVNQLSNDTKTNQHWTTYLDAIIGPDGKNIELDSIVHDTPSDKFVAILDSGFTLPQVPRYVSDAIYGRVPKAQYDKQDGLWLIPCEQELNISMVFGGKTIPVHPLDVSSSDLSATFEDGSKACVGTFQPISTAFSLAGEFDTIMGEGFLRNTYTLLDWGDFVSETSDSKGDPYIQLLSITNMNEAHQDFVNVRLGGKDTTGDPQYALLKHGQSSPVSPGERVQHIKGFAVRNAGIIAGAVIGGVVLLALFGLFGFCMRRRRRGRNVYGKGGMIPLAGGSAPSIPQQGYYRNVYDPRSAPADGGAVPMQNMQGGYR